MTTIERLRKQFDSLVKENHIIGNRAILKYHTTLAKLEKQMKEKL